MLDSSDKKPKRKRIALSEMSPIATSNEKKISAGIIANGDKPATPPVKHIEEIFIHNETETPPETIPGDEPVVFANPLPTSEKIKQKRKNNPNKRLTKDNSFGKTTNHTEKKNKASLSHKRNEDDEKVSLSFNDPSIIEDQLTFSYDDPAILKDDPAILKDDQDIKKDGWLSTASCGVN